MSDLVVRRLLIDLQAPFARHWCNGDAFLTAFFNALSLSFPVGEQFFIDAVRDGARQLPAAASGPSAAEIEGFIGQEATHRRVHALFNTQLEQQGLVNAWGPRSQARLASMAGTDPRHALAVTAATEHFTAIFAEWMLGNPELMLGTEARLQTMWLWHSAEEAEHKSTAFDLYRALGGNHAWRIVWFRRITTVFLSDLRQQTVANLRRDGTLWKWSTWRSAARHLFGRHGLVRETWKPWRAYFRADFHPSQQHSELSLNWLSANATQYAVVGAA